MNDDVMGTGYEDDPPRAAAVRILRRNHILSSENEGSRYGAVQEHAVAKQLIDSMPEDDPLRTILWVALASRAREIADGEEEPPESHIQVLYSGPYKTRADAESHIQVLGLPPAKAKAFEDALDKKLAKS